MSQGMANSTKTRRFGPFWPWIALLLLTLPAIWHVVHYETDLDPEFPKVLRPTFSRMPSPSYRLAEPGDTIDRVSIYFSSAGIVLCALGVLSSRGIGLWPAAMALVLCGFWEAANPGPTLDGWHGLGWRALANPETPTLLRFALAIGAMSLISITLTTAWGNRDRLGGIWDRSGSDGSRWLWVAGIVLMLARYTEIPRIEPQGYWPRWFLVWGLFAIDLCLLRQLPRLRFRSILLLSPVALGCWTLCVFGGIWLSWYHRPLARLRPIVPDRIFMSAMPTRRGLEVAYDRHPFKTIINLYPEDVLERSPYFTEEREFARQHGIRYVLSPADTSVKASNAFLDETLRIAQDPSAWPILVHCHACMDRTPAWMGIYRFLVEGKPLLGIMQEIEGHRGYRPKSSVTLLYNRVLAQRAPERYASDPTATILRESASGAIDPASSRVVKPVIGAAANPAAGPGVPPMEEPSTANRSGESTRR